VDAETKQIDAAWDGGLVPISEHPLARPSALLIPLNDYALAFRGPSAARGTQISAQLFLRRNAYARARAYTCRVRAGVDSFVANWTSLFVPFAKSTAEWRNSLENTKIPRYFRGHRGVFHRRHWMLFPFEPCIGECALALRLNGLSLGKRRRGNRWKQIPSASERRCHLLI